MRPTTRQGRVRTSVSRKVQGQGSRLLFHAAENDRGAQLMDRRRRKRFSVIGCLRAHKFPGTYWCFFRWRATARPSSIRRLALPSSFRLSVC